MNSIDEIWDADLIDMQAFSKDNNGIKYLLTVIDMFSKFDILGHNFAGPETKLYKRLNPDGTPKEWSILINTVDNAAYHHELCYSKLDDTKTRNEDCDKTMLGQLSGIVNPTLRERIDKLIVGKLIKAKVIFELSAPI